MNELDAKALEAARRGIGTIPGAAYWNDCETIIRLYIAALPEREGLRVTSAMVQRFMDSLFGEYTTPGNDQTWITPNWGGAKAKVRKALEDALSAPAERGVEEPRVELGPDGKEWAKTEAGYRHVESVLASSAEGPAGRVWYGHAIREAFVAGAEWQEGRAAPGQPAQGDGTNG